MASKIIYGLNLTNEIKAEIVKPNSFIVTDETVFSLYGEMLIGANYFVIPSGEDSKTLSFVGKIAEKMLEHGCNRKTTVIALGGGVVGDLTGFVASSYMRGVKWINIPTTLLSQVDSSVGGKTAVNLNDYKNLIGAFYLPEKVIISTHFLSTLPNREWLCGVGEIVKTAFLSKTVYKTVIPNLQKLLARDQELTAKCVLECVKYKEEIVSKDFKESGLRKVLNLGHTVGHAIEKVDHHQKSHGEYVLLGLEAEAYLLKDQLGKTYDEIVSAALACGVDCPEIDIKEVALACQKDKKNDETSISIMLADYENTKEIKLSLNEIYGGLEKWKSNR